MHGSHDTLINNYMWQQMGDTRQQALCAGCYDNKHVTNLSELLVASCDLWHHVITDYNKQTFDNTYHVTQTCDKHLCDKHLCDNRHATILMWQTDIWQYLSCDKQTCESTYHLTADVAVLIMWQQIWRHPLTVFRGSLSPSFQWRNQ